MDKYILMHVYINISVNAQRMKNNEELKFTFQAIQTILSRVNQWKNIEIKFCGIFQIIAEQPILKRKR